MHPGSRENNRRGPFCSPAFFLHRPLLIPVCITPSCSSRRKEELARTGHPTLSLCCAFTLIELLIVVSILVMLASPVLARTRSKAASAQCLNNLRQWGLAYRQYADDNKDFLPRRGQGIQPLALIDRPEDWFNALPGYFSSQSYQQLFATSQIECAREVRFRVPGGDRSWWNPLPPVWNEHEPLSVDSSASYQIYGSGRACPSGNTGRCARLLRLYVSLGQGLRGISTAFGPNKHFVFGRPG
jgi:prepilin-type N-terminal cleavage/methylation domain-containing protein